MAQEAAEKARTDKIDVNRASRDELIAVPGIGAAVADAIVRYREEHGRFGRVEDLANVPGVGEATLGQARERLSVPRGRGSAADDGGAARRAGGGAGERQAEAAKRTAAAAADAAGHAGEEAARAAEETATRTAEAARGMADAATEAASATAEAARGAAEAARDTAAEAARGTTEAAAEGYGELSAAGRNGTEGMVRAGREVLHGASELNGVWLSFWTEQLAEGVETMRALAGCRSWQEAAEVQGTFARASVERAFRRAARTAELTARIYASSLRAAREQGRQPEA